MARKLGLPLILVSALLVSSVVWAAEDGTAGSTYLDVLAIGVGAAPSAIVAYTAAPGDLWSLTYNPAGLSNIPRLRLGVSQIEWFDDTSFSYFGAGMPQGNGGLAMGLAYFDMGSVPKRNAMGEDAGVADANNIGFIGGYGFCMPNICDMSVGVSGHVIQGNLDDETATAIGVNFGVLYAMMEQQFRLGASVRNLGTTLKFLEEEDEQTMTFAGGLSYMTLPDQIPNASLMVGVDAIKPKDRDPGFAVGGELWLYDMMALRAGYRSGDETVGNLSAGLGFRYSDFQLDYTYTDHKDLNTSHRISLTMAFGS
ncbi:MAG: PorV/PorQ family protein [Candidatus Eisenbacteria bacterium]|nr:PorV/PorQ family protein [Candidatus Eisenbacteria bacterium]